MTWTIEFTTKNCRNTLAALLTPRLLSLLLLGGLCISVNAYGAQYYIDNSNPSCSDTGNHSTSQPWCDFTTFNATTFQPGDTIYLKSGDVWNQAVTLNGSGNSTSGPITLTSYGGGAQPKIAYGGSTPGTNVVYGSNIGYWTISGLEIEDTSTVAFDPTGNTTTSSALALSYSGSPTYSNITISSNTIHGTGTGQNNWLLMIWAGYTGTRSTDAVDNIAIQDNTIYNGGVGLVGVSGQINSAQMTHLTGGGYGNLIFEGNTAYDSALQGVLIAAALNGSIYDNLVHDTGLYTGSGVSWGAGALWTIGSYNTSVFNNEVYHSGDANISTDAPGFDVDWDNSYVTVYGNYLHDNTGAGVEVLSSDHTAIEYNRVSNNHQSTNMPAQISLNDFAAGQVHGITNATIASNVIVLSTSGSTGLSTSGTSGYTWSGNSFYYNLESFVASTQAYNLETDGLGPLAFSNYNHFDDASGSTFNGTFDGTNYNTQPSWCTATGLDCGSYLGNASGDWEAWADFAPPGHTSNQWSYNYSTNGESSYTAGAWTESTQSWNGSESYCGIYSAMDSNLGTPMMSPGGNLCDAVLTWTASGNGTVYIGSTSPITVWAGPTGCGGDGVNLRILNGTTQIWPSSGWQYIANGGNFGFPGVTTSVNAGNTLNFVVAHAGSNDYCDHVSWDPAILFY